MPMLDLLTASTLLHLAAAPIQCTLPKAPVIHITPITNEIVYETGIDSKSLSRMKSDTKSPYAPGADTATGGLREDKPRIEIGVTWGIQEYTGIDLACLWYETVDIKITLSPKIYLANDDMFKGPKCRAAIMEHEQHHVKVDRQVINRHAQKIGTAIQKIVDGSGAMGPFNKEDVELAQQHLVDNVNNIIETYNAVLSADMAQKQAQVDTLQEYQRVSAICEAEKAAGGKKR